MEHQKLEQELAKEVMARQETTAQLKELQNFIIAASKATSPEAKTLMLAQKAEEILRGEQRSPKVTDKLVELEVHAAEEWAEELGLNPNELVMLSTVERTGDHLFVEPTEATTPTKHGHSAGKKVLIIGHS